MIHRAPLAAALAILFLISPPVRAPTLTEWPAADPDPLLGPWAVNQMLLPAAAPAALQVQPEFTIPFAGLVRQGIEQLDGAWSALRATLDGAAPAFRAGLRALSEFAAPARQVAPPERAPDPEAAFMRQYFDDLFRPQTAGLGPSGGDINIAEIFMKMTAIAFAGAVVLVPAGCAGASRALYGHARDRPLAAGGPELVTVTTIGRGGTVTNFGRQCFSEKW